MNKCKSYKKIDNNLCMIYKYNLKEINDNKFIKKNAVVTIIYKRKVLVCRRGVQDSNFGKIFSQGGAVDNYESYEESAIREAKEEAGIIIKKCDLKFLYCKLVEETNTSYTNFYVICKELPLVKGPLENFTDELKEVKNILDIPTIKYNGKNTKLAWVDIDKILQCDEKTVFTKILKDINDKIIDE